MQRFKKMMTAIDMTEGTPWKKLIIFAVPLLIGNLFQQLYSTVDAIMLGHFIGDNALAAVGGSMPVLFLIMVLLMGVAVGAGIMVSQYFGAKDREALSHTIGTSITVITLLSVAVMAAGPFLTRPILIMMSTPPEILEDAALYLNVLLLGVLSIAYYNILSGIIRSLGDSFSPLLYLIISSLLNIVLNYIFIAVLGMGVYGVALGTVIVQFVSCGLCLRRLMRMRDVFDFRLRYLVPKPLYARQLLRLGVPTGVSQGVVAIAAMFVQPLVNGFGTLFIASNVILMRIDSFVMMPLFSFSNAVTVFTGQNVGAGRMDRVNKGTRQGLVIMTSTIAALVVIFLVLGPHIARLFTQTQEVIDMSTRLLRILLPWFIAFSISQVLWGVIRGAGDAVTPMWASIAITAFVRIPLAYLLVHLMAQPEAIIYGMIAAWGSHTVVSALAYRAGKWRTKGVVRKRPPENGPEEEAKGNGEEEAEAVPAMKIKTFNANPMGQNIYLYYDETANEGVLIDGGSDAADMASLASFIRESDITVRAVLLTHGHFDHITAVGEIKTLTSAPVYCHEAEKEMLGDAELNFSARMGTQTEITPDGLINDGDILRFGKIALEVRHTPGHTPGGVCYLDEANGVLFTGDTLFRESVGRTDFPTGDHQALIGNIKEKLLTLPGEVTVWPGHGPSTTVGHERNRNPYTLE